MHYKTIIPVILHKEFEVIQDITSVLCILHNTQELLSAEKTPTLALAIPLYKSIIWTWEQYATEIPELLHVIGCGITKLQDYLGFACNVPVHVLAMFINPSIKLTWIEDHWGALGASEVENMVITEMLKIQQTHLLPPSAHSTRSACNALHAQNSGYMRVITAGVNFCQASEFHNLNAESPSLDSPLVTNPAQFVSPETTGPTLAATEHLSSLDLMQFWVDHQYTYPNLYQIAMNILPAQASSISSEQVFSSSKLTMTAQRSQLSASNMEYLQVLKHALQCHCRDILDGVNADSDGLNFISHLFGEISVDDTDVEGSSST